MIIGHTHDTPILAIKDGTYTSPLIVFTVGVWAADISLSSYIMKLNCLSPVCKADLS